MHLHCPLPKIINRAPNGRLGLLQERRKERKENTKADGWAWMIGSVVAGGPSGPRTRPPSRSGNPRPRRSEGRNQDPPSLLVTCPTGGPPPDYGGFRGHPPWIRGRVRVPLPKERDPPPKNRESGGGSGPFYPPFRVCGGCPLCLALFWGTQTPAKGGGAEMKAFWGRKHCLSIPGRIKKGCRLHKKGSPAPTPNIELLVTCGEREEKALGVCRGQKPVEL